VFSADTAAFGSAPALRCALESLALSDADRERLYEGNACSVLGV
jgi:hypothetical protein